MYFYLFIIFLSSFLYWVFVDILEDDKNKPCYWLRICIAIFPLVIIEGFRDVTVGFDTQLYGEDTYLEIRHQRNIGDVFQLCINRDSHDYLFFVVNWLGYLIYDDCHSAFILCSLIKYIAVSIACLKLRNKLNSSLLFLCYAIFFYVTGFNLLRQSISIAISFLAMAFFLEKKFYLSIVMIILAYYFHSSSIIATAIIVSFYISKLKIPVWIYFLSILSCYAFSIQLMLFADSTGLLREGMANRYMDSGVISSKADILLIAGSFAIGLINLRLLKNKEVSKNIGNNDSLAETFDGQIYLYPFFVNCALALTFSFMSSYFEVAFRMAYYSTVFLWIVTFMIIKKKHSLRYTLFFLSLFLIKFFVDASHGFSEALPYSSKILGI